ncbi:hypothetical protein Tco_1516750 [Tanacetum coccineum]
MLPAPLAPRIGPISLYFHRWLAVASDLIFLAGRGLPGAELGRASWTEMDPSLAQPWGRLGSQLVPTNGDQPIIRTLIAGDSLPNIIPQIVNQVTANVNNAQNANGDPRNKMGREVQQFHPEWKTIQVAVYKSSILTEEAISCWDILVKRKDKRKRMIKDSKSSGLGGTTKGQRVKALSQEDVWKKCCINLVSRWKRMRMEACIFGSYGGWPGMKKDIAVYVRIVAVMGFHKFSIISDRDARRERIYDTGIWKDMLASLCVLDFGGSWDTQLPLAEFSYNNRFP